MSRLLVAYFSASGTTKTVAVTLSQAIGADLFEILPVQPYTQEDLDWNNPGCRSHEECEALGFRPQIASRVEDLSHYDIIFLGFPIWWYHQPPIINTFMESYDFTGKTIVTFATSGGSGLGRIPADLQAMAEGARVVKGKRFHQNVSAEDAKVWAEELLQFD